MTLMLKRWSVLAEMMAAALLLATMVGCGGGAKASLSGTVKFNGEPVAKGNIRLIPEEGVLGEGGASQITDGSYSISDETLRSGKHMVVISAFRETGRMITEEAEPDDVGAEEDDEGGEGAAAPASGGAKTVTVAEEEQYIPTNYNRQSELFVELKGGANTEDFDLQP
jgi:hypothetical protein